jgi:hypothetical protein
LGSHRAAVIARMFHTRYTLMGTSVLLHRIGYSPQVPARRAIERDEAAVTSWRREAWVRGNLSRRAGCLSFAETDYIELLDAAHQRLKARLVVIWDNLNTHVSYAMRALIDARDWLTDSSPRPASHSTAPRSWPINLCSRNFTGERRPDSPSPAGGHRSRLRRGDYRARGRASPLIYSLGMAGALLLAFSRDAEDVPCPRC